MDHNNLILSEKSNDCIWMIPVYNIRNIYLLGCFRIDMHFKNLYFFLITEEINTC